VPVFAEDQKIFVEKISAKKPVFPGRGGRRIPGDLRE
jgi:hypothetical protein